MSYLISFLLLINALFYPKPAFANCSLKKGVGGPGGCPDVPQLDERQQQIGISWFYTWHYCPDKDSYWSTDAEYVPMIRSLHNYNRSQIEKIVNQRNHRGKYWLIGNEPDGSRQDNLTPVQAAEKYGEIAYLIKEIDPTAKLIMLGLTWPNTVWKNNFLSAWRQRWPISEGYTSPEETITGWHVHVYHDLTALDAWADNAPDKELWVTEFGHLPQREEGETWTTPEQDAETKRRMKEWTNAFEENPRVNRYAYFYFGHPTNWDWAYISLFPPHYSPNNTTADLANLYASLPNDPRFSCIISPTPTPTPPTATNTPTPDTTCDCQGSSRAQRRGGDYNCDDKVTLSDLTLWVSCYFWGSDSSICDYNCDGQANMGDYETWWSGFGN